MRTHVSNHSRRRSIWSSIVFKRLGVRRVIAAFLRIADLRQGTSRKRRSLASHQINHAATAGSLKNRRRSCPGIRGPTLPCDEVGSPCRGSPFHRRGAGVLSNGGFTNPAPSAPSHAIPLRLESRFRGSVGFARRYACAPAWLSNRVQASPRAGGVAGDVGVDVTAGVRVGVIAVDGLVDGVGVAVEGVAGAAAAMGAPPEPQALSPPPASVGHAPHRSTTSNGSVAAPLAVARRIVNATLLVGLDGVKTNSPERPTCSPMSTRTLGLGTWPLAAPWKRSWLIEPAPAVTETFKPPMPLGATDTWTGERGSHS